MLCYVSVKLDSLSCVMLCKCRSNFFLISNERNKFVLQLISFVNRCLSFCSFPFGHCVVYPSSIYWFWLPLLYLQTLLTKLWDTLRNFFECIIFFLSRIRVYKTRPYYCICTFVNQNIIKYFFLPYMVITRWITSLYDCSINYSSVDSNTNVQLNCWFYIPQRIQICLGFSTEGHNLSEKEVRCCAARRVLFVAQEVIALTDHLSSLRILERFVLL